MWKTINPGDNVTLGDTVRYQPSAYNLSYKEKIYQVIKTDQHYFEIIVKPNEEDIGEYPARKIIKYMDIGYHVRVEVWMESAQTEPVHYKELAQSGALSAALF
jgi:hypothetical protein